MTYNIEYSDSNNKSPITVYDNTPNTDTSLKYPGRNFTGYGQVIAENFLHLLENFASATEPTNPTEGQLWYDSANGYLKIWGRTSWQAASNISKSLSQPSIDTAKEGELWVDLTNQQLNIFTGSRWVLVGPNVSAKDGKTYGTVVEHIRDTDGVERSILTIYVADIPVIIISKDTFTPNPLIVGYGQLTSGINLNTDADLTKFYGGFKPQLTGTASTANALTVNGFTVSANNFMRSDVISSTDHQLNVRHNSGITIGSESDFSLSYTTAAAKIYNTVAGSAIDLQTKINGLPKTTLRVITDKVGINKLDPTEALDVIGNIKTSGTLLVNGTSQTSIKTVGGVEVTKNVKVGGDLTVTGLTTVSSNIIPNATDSFILGTSAKRWNAINVKTLYAEELRGVNGAAISLSGDLAGNASSASKLKDLTTFTITGAVATTASVTFDGNGGVAKTFNTSLTTTAISSQEEATSVNDTDMVLVYRPTVGLKKMQRDTFIGGIGIPVGTLLPYAGNNVPSGYLACDGSEVSRATYAALFAAIGETYKGPLAYTGVNTFRLPDLRGRFALGRDDMGGTAANRVPSANLNGTNSGSESVTLTTRNLPDHTHTLSALGNDFSVVKVTNSAISGATTGSGPTATNGAQYYNKTGGISTTDSLSTAVGIMNPYLTISYIIKSS